MARRYKVLDVFTDRPLAGNQLAVVLDSDGLDRAAMQAIAREFNLSETVFVSPPRDPQNTAAVRIFTPAQELPFAGHPTVGTAICLAREHRSPSGAPDWDILLEEAVGLVPCKVKVSENGGFAEFECPKLPELAGDPPAKEAIGAALGVGAADIDFDAHTPSVWSAGVPYYTVPLRGLAPLAKAAANPAGWRSAFGVGAAFLYTRETDDPAHAFRARMFAPEAGIIEDPATGSAVAAFAGAVHAFERPADGDHAMVIAQGFEMRRPSLITLGMTVQDGALAKVRIGGDAVEVAEGVLHA